MPVLSSQYQNLLTPSLCLNSALLANGGGGAVGSANGRGQTRPANGSQTAKIANGRGAVAWWSELLLY